MITSAGRNRVGAVKDVIKFNPSVSGVNAGGAINTSRPAVSKAEVKAELPVAGEQVTLSGIQAPPEPPAPGPAAAPAPTETPRETPKQAPAEQPAPGPGVANGQGGTLLMTADTPAPKESAGIDGFLAKLAGVKGVVTPDQINFDNGSPVVSSAQKFVIPVPKFADGGEPLVYPQGATNKKGEDIGGQPIADWQGKPIGERGVVFFNEKDKAWQAVPGDGTGVVIMNQVTEDQSKMLLDKVGGDPGKLSLEQFKEVLTFANKEVGLGDMYNSDRGFISSKMNPLETQDTGIPQYGMFRRDDRDVCHALFLDGSGEFKGTSTTHQYDDGGVVLRQKVGNEFNYRLIQPEEFQQTYNNKDGSRINLDSLPKAL